MDDKDWRQVNLHERDWWESHTVNCTDTADEEAKQREYACLMGLEFIQGGEGWLAAPYDLKGKSVLDIGGGPVSLLLKCVNGGRRVVVDPCEWPAWVLARYQAAGIEFVQAKGEGLDLGCVFDEVWLYNVLQHVQDPMQVIRVTQRHGRVIRLFEWLDGEVNETHPHILTQAKLDGWLGTRGQVQKMNWPRYLPTAYTAVVLTDLDDLTVFVPGEDVKSDITVILTSCGRVDLLRETLKSLKDTFGRPFRSMMTDDSAPVGNDLRVLMGVAKEYGAELFTFREKHGQAWCLDFLYSRVTTPYLFHCEDDWLFLSTGYVEASMEILEQCPEVAVIGMDMNDEFRRLGAVGQQHELPSGVVYFEHPVWRIDDQHNPWHGWRGWGVKRTEDYQKLGRFQDYETEDAFDNHFHTLGLKSVWLDKTYVEHLGYGRSTFPVGPHHVWAKKMKKSLRFHLLGLAHLPTSREYRPCAYTQKVVKMATMLKNLGHTVFFYGGEGSQVECDEFIQVLSNQTRRECYGDYDWKKEFFKHDPNDLAHQTFNQNAIPAINARKRPGDFLLCPMGNYDQVIADAVGIPFTVESGIGYTGIFSKYRVFESYAWMHHVYGLMHQDDGSWYDVVIPNYFDPKDFPYQSDKGDYALFIGRLIPRKGYEVAIQVTKELGIPLIVAGQGDLPENCGTHVTHIGAVGPEKRAELMGKAKMVFTPTYYIEPFGGVAVESQMCGTPVISTDWGVFTETVLHGVTGFRCRTFDEFLWAARHADQIDPQACRDWAVKNFSMARVQVMYEQYFRNLDDLNRSGWYEQHSDRANLDWLRREFP